MILSKNFEESGRTSKVTREKLSSKHTQKLEFVNQSIAATKKLLPTKRASTEQHNKTKQLRCCLSTAWISATKTTKGQTHNATLRKPLSTDFLKKLRDNRNFPTFTTLTNMVSNVPSGKKFQESWLKSISNMCCIEIQKHFSQFLLRGGTGSREQFN